MPRLLWKDGVTKLTKISASDKVGMMFTIVVISLQKEGSEYFEHVLGSEEIVTNMRECFEMILCYWMWLKKRKYWSINNHNASIEALGSIRKMLEQIKSIWPRTKGQEWNIAKFLEQLHIIDDIIQNGPPAGSHSRHLENHHIKFVKRLSERTQKRKKEMDPN